MILGVVEAEAADNMCNVDRKCETPQDWERGWGDARSPENAGAVPVRDEWTNAVDPNPEIIREAGEPDSVNRSQKAAAAGHAGGVNKPVSKREDAYKKSNKLRLRDDNPGLPRKADNQQDLAAEVAATQDEVAAVAGTAAQPASEATAGKAAEISAAAQAARDAQTARCSKELGLCPMIDPDQNFQVVGWVPADTAVFGSYDEAKLARMNVIVGTGYKTVTLDNKQYQAYDFSGETQETSLTNLSPEAVARIKKAAEANQVQVDADGAMVVSQVYDIEEFKKRVEAFYDQQAQIQEKIAATVASNDKPEVLQGHAQGCAQEKNSGIVCSPNQLWQYIEEKTEVELLSAEDQGRYEDAVGDYAASAERVDTVLRLLRQWLGHNDQPLPVRQEGLDLFWKEHPEWFAGLSDEEVRAVKGAAGDSILLTGGYMAKTNEALTTDLGQITAECLRIKNGNPLCTKDETYARLSTISDLPVEYQESVRVEVKRVEAVGGAARDLALMPAARDPSQVAVLQEQEQDIFSKFGLVEQGDKAAAYSFAQIIAKEIGKANVEAVNRAAEAAAETAPQPIVISRPTVPVYEQRCVAGQRGGCGQVLVGYKYTAEQQEQIRQAVAAINPGLSGETADFALSLCRQTDDPVACLSPERLSYEEWDKLGQMTEPGWFNTYANLGIINDEKIEQILAGEVKPSDLERNLALQRQDPGKDLLIRWNNVTMGGTMRGALLQKEAVEDPNRGALSWDYIRGGLMVGAAPAALAVVVIGAPLAAAVVPAVAATIMSVPALTTVSTFGATTLGIASTTYSLAHTAEACPLDGTTDKWKCGLAAGNTVLMAAFTGTGVVSGQAQLANALALGRAETALTQAAAGKAVTEVMQDTVAPAVRSGAQAYQGLGGAAIRLAQTPAFQLGAKGVSIFGTGVFAANSVDACILAETKDPLSCGINLAFTAISAGRLVNPNPTGSFSRNIGWADKGVNTVMAAAACGGMVTGRSDPASCVQSLGFAGVALSHPLHDPMTGKPAAAEMEAALQVYAANPTEPARKAFLAAYDGAIREAVQTNYLITYDPRNPVEKLTGKINPALEELKAAQANLAANPQDAAAYLQAFLARERALAVSGSLTGAAEILAGAKARVGRLEYRLEVAKNDPQTTPEVLAEIQGNLAAARNQLTAIEPQVNQRLAESARERLGDYLVDRVSGRLAGVNVLETASAWVENIGNRVSYSRNEFTRLAAVAEVAYGGTNRWEVVVPKEVKLGVATRAKLEQVNQVLREIETSLGKEFRGEEAGSRNQVKIIVDALLNSGRVGELGSLGKLYEAFTGIGKTEVIIPALTAAKAKLTGKTVMTVLDSQGSLEQFVTNLATTSKPIMEMTAAELAGVEAQLSAKLGGKVLILSDQHTLAEVADPSVKIILATKDVIFDSIRNDARAAALMTKLRGGVLLADEAQQSLRLELDYVISQGKAISLKGSAQAASFAKAVTAGSIKEALAILHIEGVEAARRALGIRVVESGRSFIADEAVRNQIDRELAILARGDVEEFLRLRSAVASMVDVLGKQAGIDIRVKDGRPVLAEDSEVSGRSPSQSYDALALEEIGRRLILASNHVELKVALSQQPQEVSITPEALATNYAMFLRNFSEIYGFTGTPRYVADQFKYIYGIELKVEPSGISQLKNIFRSRITAPEQLEQAGSLREAVAIAARELGQTGVMHLVLGARASTADTLLALQQLLPGVEIILRQSENGASWLVTSAGREPLADKAAVNAKLAQARAGGRLIQLYEHGAHRGTDAETLAPDVLIVITNDRTTMTTAEQSVGRGRSGQERLVIINIGDRPSLDLYAANEKQFVAELNLAAVKKVAENMVPTTLEAMRQAALKSWGVTGAGRTRINELFDKLQLDYRAVADLNPNLEDSSTTGAKDFLESVNRARQFLAKLEQNRELPASSRAVLDRAVAGAPEVYTQESLAQLAAVAGKEPLNQIRNLNQFVASAWGMMTDLSLADITVAGRQAPERVVAAVTRIAAEQAVERQVTNQVLARLGEALRAQPGDLVRAVRLAVSGVGRLPVAAVNTLATVVRSAVPDVARDLTADEIAVAVEKGDFEALRGWTPQGRTAMAWVNSFIPGEGQRGYQALVARFEQARAGNLADDQLRQENAVLTQALAQVHIQAQVEKLQPPTGSDPVGQEGLPKAEEEQVFIGDEMFDERYPLLGEGLTRTGDYTWGVPYHRGWTSGGGASYESFFNDISPVTLRDTFIRLIEDKSAMSKGDRSITVIDAGAGVGNFGKDLLAFWEDPERIVHIPGGLQNTQEIRDSLERLREVARYAREKGVGIRYTGFTGQSSRFPQKGMVMWQYDNSQKGIGGKLTAYTLTPSQTFRDFLTQQGVTKADLLMDVFFSQDLQEVDVLAEYTETVRTTVPQVPQRPEIVSNTHVIGRTIEGENRIVLENEIVSRDHFSIRNLGKTTILGRQTAVITDLGSKNGTFTGKNPRKLRRLQANVSASIEAGEYIGIGSGRKILLRFNGFRANGEPEFVLVRGQIVSNNVVESRPSWLAQTGEKIKVWYSLFIRRVSSRELAKARVESERLINYLVRFKGDANWRQSIKRDVNNNGEDYIKILDILKVRKLDITPENALSNRDRLIAAIARYYHAQQQIPPGTTEIVRQFFDQAKVLDGLNEVNLSPLEFDEDGGVSKQTIMEYYQDFGKNAVGIVGFYSRVLEKSYFIASRRLSAKDTATTLAHEKTHQGQHEYFRENPLVAQEYDEFGALYVEWKLSGKQDGYSDMVRYEKVFAYLEITDVLGPDVLWRWARTGDISEAERVYLRNLGRNLRDDLKIYGVVTDSELYHLTFTRTIFGYFVNAINQYVKYLKRPELGSLPKREIRVETGRDQLRIERNQVGGKIPLPEVEDVKWTIGRGENSRIKFPPRTGVSENHAVVYRQGEEFFLQDVGSQLGTVVYRQGQAEPIVLERQVQEIELKIGDIIQFGSHYQVKFTGIEFDGPYYGGHPDFKAWQGQQKVGVDLVQEAYLKQALAEDLRQAETNPEGFIRQHIPDGEGFNLNFYLGTGLKEDIVSGRGLYGIRFGLPLASGYLNNFAGLVWDGLSGHSTLTTEEKAAKLKDAARELAYVLDEARRGVNFVDNLSQQVEAKQRWQEEVRGGVQRFELDEADGEEAVGLAVPVGKAVEQPTSPGLVGGVITGLRDQARKARQSLAGLDALPDWIQLPLAVVVTRDRLAEVFVDDPNLDQVNSLGGLYQWVLGLPEERQGEAIAVIGRDMAGNLGEILPHLNSYAMAVRQAVDLAGEANALPLAAPERGAVVVRILDQQAKAVEAMLAVEAKLGRPATDEILTQAHPVMVGLNDLLGRVIAAHPTVGEADIEMISREIEAGIGRVAVPFGGVKIPELDLTRLSQTEREDVEMFMELAEAFNRKPVIVDQFVNHASQRAAAEKTVEDRLNQVEGWSKELRVGTRVRQQITSKTSKLSRNALAGVLMGIRLLQGSGLVDEGLILTVEIGGEEKEWDIEDYYRERITGVTGDEALIYDQWTARRKLTILNDVMGYMRKAIDQLERNVAARGGGPFGSAQGKPAAPTPPTPPLPLELPELLRGRDGGESEADRMIEQARQKQAEANARWQAAFPRFLANGLVALGKRALEVAATTDLTPNAIQFRAAAVLANGRISRMAPDYEPAGNLAEVYDHVLAIADDEQRDQAFAVLGGITGEDIQAELERIRNLEQGLEGVELVSEPWVRDAAAVVDGFELVVGGPQMLVTGMNRLTGPVSVALQLIAAALQGEDVRARIPEIVWQGFAPVTRESPLLGRVREGFVRMQEQGGLSGQVGRGLADLFGAGAARLQDEAQLKSLSVRALAELEQDQGFIDGVVKLTEGSALPPALMTVGRNKIASVVPRDLFEKVYPTGDYGYFLTRMTGKAAGTVWNARQGIVGWLENLAASFRPAVELEEVTPRVDNLVAVASKTREDEVNVQQHELVPEAVESVDDWGWTVNHVRENGEALETGLSEFTSQWGDAIGKTREALDRARSNAKVRDDLVLKFASNNNPFRLFGEKKKQAISKLTLTLKGEDKPLRQLGAGAFRGVWELPDGRAIKVGFINEEDGWSEMVERDLLERDSGFPRELLNNLPKVFEHGRFEVNDSEIVRNAYYVIVEKLEPDKGLTEDLTSLNENVRKDPRTNFGVKAEELGRYLGTVDIGVARNWGVRPGGIPVMLDLVNWRRSALDAYQSWLAERVKEEKATLDFVEKFGDNPVIRILMKSKKVKTVSRQQVLGDVLYNQLPAEVNFGRWSQKEVYLYADPDVNDRDSYYQVVTGKISLNELIEELGDIRRRELEESVPWRPEAKFSDIDEVIGRLKLWQQGREAEALGKWGAVEAPPQVIAIHPQMQYKVTQSGKVVNVPIQAQEWDRVMGGTIIVWRNPEDGRLYVVNGHHRVELLDRLSPDKWPGSIKVKLLTPELIREEGLGYLMTGEEISFEVVRKAGAFLNLREGRGTKQDTLKFLVDQSLNEADVLEAGISLDSANIRYALKALKLHPEILQLALEVSDIAIGDDGVPKPAFSGGFYFLQDLEILADVLANPEDQSALYRFWRNNIFKADPYQVVAQDKGDSINLRTDLFTYFAHRVANYGSEIFNRPDYELNRWDLFKAIDIIFSDVTKHSSYGLDGFTEQLKREWDDLPDKSKAYFAEAGSLEDYFWGKRVASYLIRNVLVKLEITANPTLADFLDGLVGDFGGLGYLDQREFVRKHAPELWEIMLEALRRGNFGEPGKELPRTSPPPGPPSGGPEGGVPSRPGPVGGVSPLAAVPITEGLAECVTGDTKLRRKRRKNAKLKVKNSKLIDFEDVAIKDIKAGDEIVTLNEATGAFVLARVKRLMDKGVQAVWQLTTESGKTIKTTAEHPYLTHFASEPDSNFVLDLTTTTVKEFARRYYQQVLVGKVFVKALQEDVTISHAGWNHLQLKPRSKFDALTRFFALPKVLLVFEKAEKVFRHNHRIEHRRRVDYWELRETIDGVSIKILIRSVSRGPKHFYSVIWKGENNKKVGNVVSRLYPRRQGISTLQHQAHYRLYSTFVQELSRVGFEQRWAKVRFLTSGMEIAVADEDGGLAWERIETIEKIGQEQVYDIEIEGTHNFVGNGIVAHNTAFRVSPDLATEFDQGKLRQALEPEALAALREWEAEVTGVVSDAQWQAVVEAKLIDQAKTAYDLAKQKFRAKAQEKVNDVFSVEWLEARAEALFEQRLKQELMAGLEDKLNEISVVDEETTLHEAKPGFDQSQVARVQGAIHKLGPYSRVDDWQEAWEVLAEKLEPRVAVEVAERAVDPQVRQLARTTKRDVYADLGVKPDAKIQEIEVAYQQKFKQLTWGDKLPGVLGRVAAGWVAPQRQVIDQAYAVLTQARAEYNRNPYRNFYSRTQGVREAGQAVGRFWGRSWVGLAGAVTGGVVSVVATGLVVGNLVSQVVFQAPPALPPPLAVVEVVQRVALPETMEVPGYGVAVRTDWVYRDAADVATWTLYRLDVPGEPTVLLLADGRIVGVIADQAAPDQALIRMDINAPMKVEELWNQYLLERTEGVDLNEWLVGGEEVVMEVPEAEVVAEEPEVIVGQKPNLNPGLSLVSQSVRVGNINGYVAIAPLSTNNLLTIVPDDLRKPVNRLVGQDNDAVLEVNANFFEVTGDGKIVPIGLFGSNGQVRFYRPTRTGAELWSLVLDSLGNKTVVKTDEVTNVAGLEFAVTGMPALIKDGEALPLPDWIQVPSFRTAVGINRMGELVILSTHAVIGSQLQSALLEMGVVDAVNLDGGSTSRHLFVLNNGKIEERMESVDDIATPSLGVKQATLIEINKDSGLAFNDLVTAESNVAVEQEVIFDAGEVLDPILAGKNDSDRITETIPSVKLSTGQTVLFEVIGYGYGDQPDYFTAGDIETIRQVVEETGESAEDLPEVIYIRKFAGRLPRLDPNNRGLWDEGVYAYSYTEVGQDGKMIGYLHFNDGYRDERSHLYPVIGGTAIGYGSLRHEFEHLVLYEVGENESKQESAALRAFRELANAGLIENLDINRTVPGDDQIEDLADVLALYKTVPEWLRQNYPAYFRFAEYVDGGGRDFVALKQELAKEGSDVAGNLALPLPAGLLTNLWRHRLAVGDIASEFVLGKKKVGLRASGVVKSWWDKNSKQWWKALGDLDRQLRQWEGLQGQELKVEAEEVDMAEAIREELLTQKFSSGVISDENRAITAQADTLFVLIDRGVVKWPKERAGQLEVVMSFLAMRQESISKIRDLVQESYRVIDLIEEKYGGYTISDPSEFDPETDRFLVVDEVIMDKIRRNQSEVVPAGLYLPRYDVIVLNEESPDFDHQAQRFLDHELSHQSHDLANNGEFWQAVKDHFGERDYKGRGRLIYEGRNELITYFIARERARLAGETIPSAKEFGSELYWAFGDGFTTFDYDIRETLRVKGLADEKIDRLLLSIGPEGYKSLVDELGGWDVFLSFFDNLEEAALDLMPAEKFSPEVQMAIFESRVLAPQGLVRVGEGWAEQFTSWLADKQPRWYQGWNTVLYQLQKWGLYKGETEPAGVVANGRIARIAPDYEPAGNLAEVYDHVLAIADDEQRDQAFAVLGGITGEDIQLELERISSLEQGLGGVELVFEPWVRNAAAVVDGFELVVGGPQMLVTGMSRLTAPVSASLQLIAAALQGEDIRARVPEIIWQGFAPVTRESPLLRRLREGFVRMQEQGGLPGQVGRGLADLFGAGAARLQDEAQLKDLYRQALSDSIDRLAGVEEVEVLQQAEPETPKAESERALTSALESKRKIAAETGKFYNSFLDTYLEVKTPEEQQAQTASLVESLPGPMKKLYGEGLGKFQEELNENHALLEQHRGDEVRYLLGAVMASEGRSAEEMEEIFQQIDKAKFIEPSPGIAIIQAEKDFFRLLKEHGIVHAEGHAVNFGSDNRGEPSFLMIQRLSLEKSMAEDNGQAKANRSVRHETHHFIWNFLQRRGDFLREAAESTPELTKAFRHFRDEVAAYIIEGRGVGGVEPELLTYTEDKEILKLASDARDFITICVDVARQRGIDPQNFLYASMSSRNFAELKDGFATLTPLEKIDQAGIAALYTAWAGNYRAAPKVVELLERKKLTIPTNLVEEYGKSRMVSADLTSMGRIISELKNVKRFAGAVGLDQIDERSLIEKAARARLPLPKETVDVILALPREQADNIPLGKSGEEFLGSFVSFWNINQESARAAYKQIIDSSPAMRESFDKVREGIISKGAESYRGEFRSSGEERKQKVESEIQERTKLLMEL